MQTKRCRQKDVNKKMQTKRCKQKDVDKKMQTKRCRQKDVDKKMQTKRCRQKDVDKKMQTKRCRQKDVDKKMQTKRCRQKDVDNKMQTKAMRYTLIHLIFAHSRCSKIRQRDNIYFSRTKPRENQMCAKYFYLEVRENQIARNRKKQKNCFLVRKIYLLSSDVNNYNI